MKNKIKITEEGLIKDSDFGLTMGKLWEHDGSHYFAVLSLGEWEFHTENDHWDINHHEEMAIAARPFKTREEAVRFLETDELMSIINYIDVFGTPVAAFFRIMDGCNNEHGRPWYRNGFYWFWEDDGYTYEYGYSSTDLSVAEQTEYCHAFKKMYRDERLVNSTWVPTRNNLRVEESENGTSCDVFINDEKMVTCGARGGDTFWLKNFELKSAAAIHDWILNNVQEFKYDPRKSDYRYETGFEMIWRSDSMIFVPTKNNLKVVRDRDGRGYKVWVDGINISVRSQIFDNTDVFSNSKQLKDWILQNVKHFKLAESSMFEIVKNSD